MRKRFILILIIFLLCFQIYTLNKYIIKIKGLGVKKIEKKDRYLCLLSKDNNLMVYDIINEYKKVFVYKGKYNTNFYILDDYIFLFDSYKHTEVFKISLDKNVEIVENHELEYLVEKVYIKDKLYLFLTDGSYILMDKNLNTAIENPYSFSDFPLWREKFYILDNSLYYIFKKNIYKFDKNRFVKKFSFNSNNYFFNNNYLLYLNKYGHFVLFDLSKKNIISEFMINKNYIYSDFIKIKNNKIYFVLEEKLLVYDFVKKIILNEKKYKSRIIDIINGEIFISEKKYFKELEYDYLTNIFILDNMKYFVIMRKGVLEDNYYLIAK
ncbi:MAG TPA: hypothetical protein VKN74_07035 [Candidatus Mcinerneyibacterium sp.]|nr:hypothetical protein [Candidatus Mcinerneyibacterium sp.]